MLNEDTNIKKWGAVLDHESAAPIQDNYRRSVTAKLLENTEVAQRQQLSESNFGSGTSSSSTDLGVVGSANGFDPILISMVRRAMPNLIAYDVAGVQPMSGPTGLIFALKAHKSEQTTSVDTDSPELLHPAIGADIDTAFSAKGQTGPTEDSPFAINDIGDTVADGEGNPNYAPATGNTLAIGEGDAFNSAGISIEKTSVTAVTRALKAEYSMEMAQDLKAIHGLDAESELANILSAEILAEINREVIRKIVTAAKLGLGNIAKPAGATKHTFDLVGDADGRWAVEKFKSLIFQLEVEANTIAKETRRGKGNIIICSSNVASALAASGSLDYANAISANLNVDDSGNTFAGTLNGRMKVYIDPYAASDYAVVGYKGTSPFDAGLFYCPYVPLTMVRAIDETTFQPKMAFKTRYGLVANPFASLTIDSNQYYRKFGVSNINVGGSSSLS
tara:strand:+ start:5551 stop:6894 length:1344 start_codon:yes stop_codon:yes gene_type:complete